MERGAWWAILHRVSKRWTWLSMRATQCNVLTLLPYCCGIWYITPQLWTQTSHLYSEGWIRWSWHSLPACSLHSKFQKCLNTQLVQGRKHKRRNCIWMWPMQGCEVQELGCNHPTPIWPCIHFSVHSSSRYHYNSDRESNTTDDSHCVQKASPWMKKALWKKERSEHFSQDLGVVITLLHPWNQAKMISDLVSALNIWVTSGSLFNFSKLPSLSVKTRVSAMPPSLGGCDTVAWVLRIGQGSPYSMFIAIIIAGVALTGSTINACIPPVVFYRL